MKARWKLLGLAGAAGVAATGVIAARNRRPQSDYTPDELFAIAEQMARGWNYAFDDDARVALREYIAARVQQPHFANARSMRNALDRARLRQANRLFDGAAAPIDAIALQTLSAADIRASRVLADG